jgi:myo-inositol-hexaphosphate 3-phosphohydrolase
MVFDRTTNDLYAAQEDVGVWRIPQHGKPELLETGQPGRRDAGFEVVDGRAADGVQHSDGAAVTTQPLGPRFPHGLFAVHDGENTPGDGDREGTDFKLVRLEKLA